MPAVTFKTVDDKKRVYPTLLLAELQAETVRIGKQALEGLKEYPSQPTQSPRQRQTGTRRRGNIEVNRRFKSGFSKRQGKYSDEFTGYIRTGRLKAGWKLIEGVMKVTLRNNVPYAIWVHGRADGTGQAEWHAQNRWPLFAYVIGRVKATLVINYEKIIARSKWFK